MDPLTLAAGTLALTEGIKFVFEQARDLIKRWHDKRDRRDETAIEVPATTSPALDAELQPATIEQEFVAEHQQDLAALRSRLTPYAEDGLEPDRNDRELLAAVDALRRLLEVGYGQRITFRGEDRPQTGIRIDSRVEAADVEGYVAAVRAGNLAPGTRVKAETVVRDVKPGGSAIGVDLSSPPSP